MALPLNAPLLATLLVLAADNIPAFNIEPHCRALAEKTGFAQDRDVCLQQEQAARQQLGVEWTQFTPAGKSHCLRLSTLGNDPTYTELLTCLELDRDARQLREQNEREKRHDEDFSARISTPDPLPNLLSYIAPPHLVSPN
jgi:hypothetical protein